MSYKATRKFYDGQVLGFVRKGDAVDVSSSRAQDLLDRGLIAEAGGNKPTGEKSDAKAPTRTDKMQRPHKEVSYIDKSSGWYDITVDGEVVDTVRGKDARDAAIKEHSQ